MFPKLPWRSALILNMLPKINTNINIYKWGFIFLEKPLQSTTEQLTIWPASWRGHETELLLQVPVHQDLETPSQSFREAIGKAWPNLISPRQPVQVVNFDPRTATAPAAASDLGSPDARPSRTYWLDSGGGITALREEHHRNNPTPAEQATNFRPKNARAW